MRLGKEEEEEVSERLIVMRLAVGRIRWVEFLPSLISGCRSEAAVKSELIEDPFPPDPRKKQLACHERLHSKCMMMMCPGGCREC